MVLCLRLAAGAQTVDAVIAKYIAFTGGEQYWKTVETIVMSGTYNYGGMVFPFTSYSKRPGRYKYVVPFKGNYFAQAFDGENGWKIDAFKGETQKTLLTGTQARAMANEADVELEPLFINYQTKGYQATLEGKDTVAGTECVAVKLAGQNGETGTYFFDSNTFALLKKTAASKNAELEQAMLDTYYSDYRKVKGLMLPFKTVSKTNGQTILTITIKTVALNRPVADTIFKP